MENPQVLADSSQGLSVFMPILILMVLGVVIFWGAVLVAGLIRPSKPSKLKQTAYECGELPVGQAWSHFNIRFYVTGLIFIIFDVESALMFPAASVFKKLNSIGLGGLALIEILLFVMILVAGIAYCWSKGDLDWVKSLSSKEK